MLDQVQHWNDLSPDLRKKLEERVNSFGKKVRYKFAVARPNPDPEKYNGEFVYPEIYTLDPITFRITDKDEKRQGKSTSKMIGNINELDDKGLPKSFFSFLVSQRVKGIVELNLEDSYEDREWCKYLELHPKVGNGLMPDKEKRPVATRIDEAHDAKEQREKRAARKKATDAAAKMSDSEILTFAAAMDWDINAEMEYLRNKVEETAEKSPELFNDFSGSENMQIQAVVKKCLDRQIVSFNPADWKFLWTANNEVIATLEKGVSNKNHIESFAEWLKTSGAKGNEVYKRLESLSKS